MEPDFFQITAFSVHTYHFRGPCVLITIQIKINTTFTLMLVLRIAQRICNCYENAKMKHVQTHLEPSAKVRKYKKILFCLDLQLLKNLVSVSV